MPLSPPPLNLADAPEHGSSPPRSPAAALELGPVRLTSAGAAFSVHPTREPIQLLAAPAGSARACPAGLDGRTDVAGGSFGGRWRDGCRNLTGDPESLPATDGRTHVTFVVKPVAASGPTILAHLRITWTCADTYFIGPAGVSNPCAP
ncbi:MAG: hypothetical protein AB7I38_15270 [Dehalococcoidia bacterium]